MQGRINNGAIFFAVLCDVSIYWRIRLPMVWLAALTRVRDSHASRSMRKYVVPGSRSPIELFVFLESKVERMLHDRDLRDEAPKEFRLEFVLTHRLIDRIERIFPLVPWLPGGIEKFLYVETLAASPLGWHRNQIV